jgi:hypothetical protein
MKLFIRSILIFFVPILFLIGIYVWTDPFKTIYNYNIYLSDIVMLSRGYISTEVFLKHNHEYDFNSFIFGSSRSCAFTSKEWSNYLSKDCSAFSYGAWNESIEGICRKIEFIDAQGNKIKNALIVLDTDLTFQKGNSSLETDHYLISGKSFGQYQMRCFSAYVKKFWLVPASVDYKLFKTQRFYMKGFVGMKTTEINPVNNDFGPNSEDVILKDSTAYYSGSLNNFYSRSKTFKEYGVQISTGDSIMMQKVNSIFKKHNTNVLIIIGPLYDQKKFNRKDMLVFQNIFGSENIFDFSGINSITDNMYSFAYDAIHYRKRTGARILKSIYTLRH